MNEANVENLEKIESITAEELQDKIEHAINLTVVNVLDKEFFDDCHIKGSINAPLNHLQTIAKAWPKSREIIVYCAKGITSKKAYKLLKELGFEKVLEYPGGMREWKEKSLNVVGECKVEY